MARRAWTLRDEDRLPWLETVERTSMTRGRRSAASSRWSCSGWSCSRRSSSASTGCKQRARRPATAQLIAAQEGDYKVKPDDPGGLKVEGEGDCGDRDQRGQGGQRRDRPARRARSAGRRASASRPRPRPMPTAAATRSRRCRRRAASWSPRRRLAASRPDGAGSGGGGSLVQLGAFPSEAVANAAWTSFSKRFAYLARSASRSSRSRRAAAPCTACASTRAARTRRRISAAVAGRRRDLLRRELTSLDREGFGFGWSTWPDVGCPSSDASRVGIGRVMTPPCCRHAGLRSHRLDWLPRCRAALRVSRCSFVEQSGASVFAVRPRPLGVIGYSRRCSSGSDVVDSVAVRCGSACMLSGQRRVCKEVGYAVDKRAIASWHRPTDDLPTILRSRAVSSPNTPAGRGCEVPPYRGPPSPSRRRRRRAGARPTRCEVTSAGVICRVKWWFAASQR